MAKTADTKFILIDASDESFGRFASKLAHTLQGKDRADYASNKAPDRHIVVINCAAIKLPARRVTAKKYHHTKYLGNLKEEEFGDRPTSYRLQEAVRLMLPKNHHSRTLIKKLHCYDENKHPYKAQIK